MCREGCSGAGFKIDSSVSVDKVFLIEIRWDGGRMQRRSRASAHLRHGFRIISIAWCFFRSTAAARRGLFRLNGLLARATNAARACGGGGLWGVAVSGQTRIHWESSPAVPLRLLQRTYRIPHLLAGGVSEAIPRRLQLQLNVRAVSATLWPCFRRLQCSRPQGFGCDRWK